MIIRPNKFKLQPNTTLPKGRQSRLSPICIRERGSKSNAASRFWRSGQFWSIWGSKVRSSRSPSRWAGMVLCRPHQRQSRSWCSYRWSMKGPCEHAFSWWSWVGFRRCRLCQKPTPRSWASAEMASWSRMYPSLRRRVGTSQRRREWTESQTSCTLLSEW